MLGIVGCIFFNRNANANDNNVKLMVEPLTARIGTRAYVAKLTECGLQIGALESKREENPGPYRSESSGVTVYLVGEFYNDDSVNFDNGAEYLAKRYSAGPKKIPRDLNGSFVALVADSRRHEVHLVTDHTSSIPLYFCEFDDRLYFATEVKAILAVKEVDNTPDDIGMVSYITNGFLCNRHTLAKDIWQADYATVYTIVAGSLSVDAYWRYQVSPERPRLQQEYVDELSPLLVRAVKRRVTESRSAILLSGGVDSRAILSALTDPKKVKAVTYTLRTNEERHPLGDWAIAEEISAKLGLEHYLVTADRKNFLQAIQESIYISDGAAGFIFENLWDQIANMGICDYLLLGDQCMGGYSQSLKRQVLYKVGINTLKDCDALKSCLKKDSLEHFVAISASQGKQILEPCRTLRAQAAVDYLHMTQRVIHFINPKRRVIAYHGFGIRNPWLDREILDYMCRMPTKFRVSKQIFRLASRNLNPSIGGLPEAKSGETVSYIDQINELESKGTISDFIFLGNPWFEKYFETASVERLIARVGEKRAHQCEQRSSASLDFLHWRIRKKINMFRKPVPQMGDEALLLRVMTCAEALRQLHGRFASKP